MPLNAEYLKKLALPSIEQVLSDHDVMLYALSIGLGTDSLDAYDLRYVYEENLKVFPTMPLVVGHPGAFSADRRTGISRAKLVHGAQRLSTFSELPIGRPILSTNRVIGIYDKGDRGAILVVERETRERDDGPLISRSEMTLFCRADGNFGGQSGPAYEFTAVPPCPPHMSLALPIPSNAALLYRLNQDRNPLHADPQIARRAGFERPILHGLCTLGISAVAITRAFPGRTLRSIEVRFSNPVFPGDTVTLELWNDEETLAFQARIATRGSLVLDRGRATLT
jgi:acyl dehydratase